MSRYSRAPRAQRRGTPPPRASRQSEPASSCSCSCSCSCSRPAPAPAPRAPHRLAHGPLSPGDAPQEATPPPPHSPPVRGGGAAPPPYLFGGGGGARRQRPTVLLRQPPLRPSRSFQPRAPPEVATAMPGVGASTERIERAPLVRRSATRPEACGDALQLPPHPRRGRGLLLRNRPARRQGSAAAPGAFPSG